MRLEKMDIEKIIAFLKEKMTLRLLILFGSYASGEARPDSDIDLAFVADEKIESATLLLDIAPELAAFMHVDSVDLIDMKNTKSDVFLFEIVSSGKIIFQEGDFDVFLDLIYTKYLQLNDDRKEILEYYEEQYHHQ